MDNEVTLPKLVALLKVSFFHSGTSPALRPAAIPLKSCAKWRSPGSGKGSNHGILMSFGTESNSAFACCCLNHIKY